MTWSWLIIALLLIACGVLAWRYLALRRDIHAMTAQLRRRDDPAESASELGGLASALNARLATLNLQLSTLDIEHAKLSAILDQLTDGVLIADADGRIQFANPAAERLFGENLLGHTVPETLRHHQLIQTWHRSQENDELQSDSVELPARRQFLQLVVVPDRHVRGGSLLLVQNLTRLRRLETVRRDFVSNLSHELRTPLASLRALTETLQDGALDDPPAANRFLDQMSVEVDALTQMVSELLELSRIESGQVTLDLKPVSACELISSAAERMRLQAERAGLALRVDCLPDLPKVRADQMRLGQVLVNLIHNAVKFTRPGGEVILLAEPAEGAVCFVVRDTGVGISVDDLSRIFERFYKSDRSRSGGGTGLGLSIARHIVEAHGGRIWAESRQGEGSSFFFTIPLG
ncbi:MAG: PAS domain-containing protein [Chloroflexi bacterium]|nr:PAS domain-containing protein [Chloroflexota bacterium]